MSPQSPEVKQRVRAREKKSFLIAIGITAAIVAAVIGVIALTQSSPKPPITATPEASK